MKKSFLSMTILYMAVILLLAFIAVFAGMLFYGLWNHIIWMIALAAAFSVVLSIIETYRNGWESTRKQFYIIPTSCLYLGLWFHSWVLLVIAGLFLLKTMIWPDAKFEILGRNRPRTEP